MQSKQSTCLFCVYKIHNSSTSPEKKNGQSKIDGIAKAFH